MSTSLSDTGRLAALQATRLLDAPSTDALDGLTRLASRCLAAPIALVSLVDDHRQFFASQLGLPEPWASRRGTMLSHSMCQHVVTTGGAFIVTNAPLDPRVADNGAVTELGVTAYLGVPLTSEDGHTLGSFCVIDSARREWTDADRIIAEDFARAAMAEIKSRTLSHVLARTLVEYGELLDTTTELVCTADADGVITYVNRAWCDAFGYEADEVIGTRAIDHVCPEDRARYVKVGREVQGGAPIDVFEVRAFGKDGRRVICRGSANALFANDVALPGTVGCTTPDAQMPRHCIGTRAVYRDVTIERQAEAERAQLVSTFESTNDFVGITRGSGEIVYVNRAGRRMLGLTDAEDLSQHNGFEFHTPTTRALLRDEAIPASRKHGVWKGEGELLSRQGEAIPVAISLTQHPSIFAGEPAYVSAIMHDQRERVAAERALHESEARLSLIYDHVSDLMTLMRVERGAGSAAVGFRCESVNAALTETLGRPASAFVNQPLERIASPENYPRLRAAYDAVVQSGQPQQVEIVSRAQAGDLCIDTVLSPVLDARGLCTHVLASSRDVTAKRRAEAALRESEIAFRELLETVRAVAVTLDTRGVVTFANDALSSITGWPRDEIVGQDWFERFVPEAFIMRQLFTAMVSGEDMVSHYENEIFTRTGRRRLIVWDTTVLRDADGNIIGTASIGQDVTQQRAAEARLESLTEEDELTGLLNRRGFSARVDEGLRAAARVGRADALLYIDLDKFKLINDTFGHGEGDNALRAVAAVLRDTIRETDHACRLGGDEFAVYATGLGAPIDSEALRKRILTALAAHNALYASRGRRYSIALSMGIAETRFDDTRDRLLARADGALYTVKKHGKRKTA